MTWPDPNKPISWIRNVDGPYTRLRIMVVSEPLALQITESCLQKLWEEECYEAIETKSQDMLLSFDGQTIQVQRQT